MRLVTFPFSLFLFAIPLISIVAPAESAAEPAPESARLQALFDREWEIRLREDPFTATAVGRHEYDHLLPSMTMADLERRAAIARELFGELAGIDRARLAREEQVSYDIFRRELEDGLADFELETYEMPWNADSGFHTEFSRLADGMPLATVEGYESYIARLRAWPRYVEQMIALMRGGVRRGFTLPAAVLDGYEGTMAAHVVEDATKSVFYRPFETFPAAVPAASHARLRAQGLAAVREGAIAGYEKLLAFYLGEYRPAARASIAATELPDGARYYQHLIRRFTTLELTAEQIHQIGLAEVARIDAEMKEVMRQTGFTGDFAAFLHFLRTDPRFYAKTPEDLLREASYIAKRMDGKLPALFGRLPRSPYTVEPVPAHIAPKYTSGRYVDPPAGGKQPGIYWVNTYKLENRPLYNLEALTLHEAVPGHHLQNALARELDALPTFRRFLYYSGFGEGWGLYSEYLGLEAGFYRDPYSNFGRLTYEMWRACRLVVDTGMHALGWSRQQALDYLASHTALPLHEVTTEIDRYISWPGQALAYKLGEIKIRELRKRAEARLGERFDVRAFHDVVLGSGAVPLTVLEQNVERYLAESTAR